MGHATRVLNLLLLQCCFEFGSLNDSIFRKPPRGPVGDGFPREMPTKPPPPTTTTPDPRTLTCGTVPDACPESKYRSYDGTCNNLLNPLMGAAHTPYARLLPPNYGDGISAPARAESGDDLPNARLASLLYYPPGQFVDKKHTLIAMQYGQIVAHDMSMIAGNGTLAEPQATTCCSRYGKLLPVANMSQVCFPILLQKNDPIRTKTQAECMNFIRTITDRDRRCIGENQPVEQLSEVNHYLDLSIVYGNNEEVNQELRQFQNGLLLTSDVDGQEWLPRNKKSAAEVCYGRRMSSEACYRAGDPRANQSPHLAILHLILLREHNRIARALASINPHWDDETIFQEARKITIAEHQHIAYYEWLPNIIGWENALENKIVFHTKNFVNDYREDADVSVLNEHATAAFRFFHSLISGHLSIVDERRGFHGKLRLSDWYNRPGIIAEGPYFYQLTRGLVTQPSLASDEFHDNETTQFLFRSGQPFGLDLKAICIQRNRDHALASYNSFREFCGLSRAESFEDLLDVISGDNVNKLNILYESPDDIDLTVGGSLEELVPGTLVGPTFLCILTKQFSRTRAGDRFWFENENNGFSLEQLDEIRKTSISKLICDNSKKIRSIQPRGFEQISSDNNLVPCTSLPTLDLSLWKENPTCDAKQHACAGSMKRRP